MVNLHEELAECLGLLIGTEPRELSKEFIETLLLIGRGMLWSEERHSSIKTLALEIKEEFEAVSKQGF